MGGNATAYGSQFAHQRNNDAGTLRKVLITAAASGAHETTPLVADAPDMPAGKRQRRVTQDFLGQVFHAKPSTDLRGLAHAADVCLKWVHQHFRKPFLKTPPDAIAAAIEVWTTQPVSVYSPCSKDVLVSQLVDGVPVTHTIIKLNRAPTVRQPGSPALVSRHKLLVGSAASGYDEVGCPPEYSLVVSGYPYRRALMVDVSARRATAATRRCSCA